MKLTGITAAPGLAVGPVFVHRARGIVPADERIAESEVSSELALFEDAVSRLVEKLTQDRERLRAEGREDAAQILEAHEELAQDPELAESVEEKIRDLTSARATALRAREQFVETFRAMEDEYMAARAEGVEDVARQLAAELARGADFLSVGTNDLTQYTLAADRGNEGLAPYLPDAGHPAILALVRLTCEAAREEGVPVGVCGEAAGDPEIVPKLIEAGASELSIAPPMIPWIKKLVSEL